MGRKKDPQRMRVYKWQWQWFDWNRPTLTYSQCEDLIKKACDVWDIHPPRFIGRMPNGGGYSVYDEGCQSLKMLPSQFNPAIALHEAAHHIIQVRYGAAYEDHGPEWLGVYVDLLVAFHIAPESAITASLKESRLKHVLPRPRTKLMRK